MDKLAAMLLGGCQRLGLLQPGGVLPQGVGCVEWICLQHVEEPFSDLRELRLYMSLSKYCLALILCL